MREITFKDAIREAQEQLLLEKSVFVIGEGVGDPKNVFGTTAGLKDKFPTRVFDMPISENGCTGICIGAALNGMKPILVHQRIDFALYSMDQIVNNAAKWYSMFGGQRSVPLVIRMIVGRGWGQGNQHSQNLTSLFAHIPGIKIVCPSNAYDAKGLLISSVKDPNPVLFIEHRWLYETTSTVPEEMYSLPIGVNTVTPGNDITVVASGHAYIECLKARSFLGDEASIELIGLKTIKPRSFESIYKSVEKTRKLLVVDDSWRTCGLAGEIIASVVEKNHSVVCKRMTYPDYPSASSPALTKNYYPEAADIAQTIQNMLGRGCELFEKRSPHDVPDPKMFIRGPF